jgi:hypothetical protein
MFNEVYLFLLIFGVLIGWELRPGKSSALLIG